MSRILNRILNTLPVRAKALLIAGIFKAFALTIIFALGKIKRKNLYICKLLLTLQENR